MKEIIIVGAGGFGRETLTLIKRINKLENKWIIKGFIDDNPHSLEGKDCGYGIIGSIQDWNPSDNEVFAMGISSPQAKEKVVRVLKERGVKFETLISPNSIINESAKIGEGCVIKGFSVVGEDVVLGDFVDVAGSMIGQDSVIGNYSTTTGFANIVCANVGSRVFIGSHAVILNNVKIGDDAFVCAGSICYGNVKPGKKVFGNPAKIFKI